jgi:hypothetical protein
VRWVFTVMLVWAVTALGDGPVATPTPALRAETKVSEAEHQLDEVEASVQRLRAALVGLGLIPAKEATDGAAR